MKTKYRNFYGHTVCSGALVCMRKIRGQRSCGAGIREAPVRTKILFAFAAFIIFALPPTVFAQNVAAWFSNPANSAVYGAIADEVKAMAQQFQSLGLSDSILAARLEEGYRKRVNIDILAASLRIDAQRAAQLSVMLREKGLFPSDRKAATSTVEQMLIFVRAGLTETEMRTALQAGVTKSGKNARAVSRALAALAAVADSAVQSGLTEEERLKLELELIASELSESQFESVLAAKKASQSSASAANAAEAASKSSENGQGSQNDHKSTSQGEQGGASGQGGQDQGVHGKK